MEEKILVVDDDSNLCRLVEIYLKKADYEVITANDGEKALKKYHEFNPDLVVLDIMLPKLNGWEVCQKLREKYSTPILMLTAKGDKEDKVKGLDIGADDYVTKPFDPDELVARVKAILRRTKEQDKEFLSFPNLTIDHKKRLVEIEGQELTLAPKEYDLLYFLAKNAQRVFSREQLLDQVWGFDFIGDIRTVDSHIKRVRNKVDQQIKDYDYLHTVWGVGYKFEVQQDI